MARVLKKINWDIVELFLKAGSTQTKIAEYLGIDRDTLRDRAKKKYGMEYSALSASFCCEGELMIEAKQYQKAMKDYWPALLWLGKVRLGQREPEMISLLANNQQQLDQTHRIMELEHQLAELKANHGMD